MLDKPAYFPLPPSSLRLQQQERRLPLYHSPIAVMSNRERDRLAGRLSPEPHLEMMRPVSPFQSKRQFAHQQLQSNHPSDSLNSHYHSQPNSQSYAQARPSRVPEMTTTSTHSSNAYSKPGAYKGEGRSARGVQRDADISPALRMMSYDTSMTPPSSDGGHGRSAHTHARETHTILDRTEHIRSTSPEPVGGKRKDPSWRKPAPKYIPTPPSTPPPTLYERFLPSSNEPVPPVPTNAQPLPVKTYSTPTPLSRVPPPRPGRTETDHHVPAMFRELKMNHDPPRTKLAPSQPQSQSQPNAQVVPFSKSIATLTSSLKPVQTQAQTQTQTQAQAQTQTQAQVQVQAQVQPPPPLPVRAQISHSAQTHAPVRVEASALAQTAGHSFSPLTLTPAQPPKVSDVRGESPKSALVHPQPKKVPSMAQLVAMVLPSRSPSPKILPLTENGNVSPPKPAVAVRSQSQTPPQLTVLGVESTRTPSPAHRLEESHSSCAACVQLLPDQVLLPPSAASSAKSSRSVSPHSSPLQIPAPLPVRPRSPAPVIPQYAPPPPPFPPPPPNTPIVAPRPRSIGPLQFQLSSKLIEQSAAAKLAPVACASTEEKLGVERKHTPPLRTYLATPPTTPPSAKHSEPETKSEDAVLVSSPVVALIGRSRSPAPPTSSVPMSIAAPVPRPALTGQKELLVQDENRTPRDALSISRPTTPVPMLTPPVPPSTPTNAGAKEDRTPPLPMDWKETITRAIRSSVNPNLPMVTQATEHDKKSSTLSPTKPSHQVLDEEKDDLASTYVITESWQEETGHATTALELHVHEVEARHISDIVDANLPLEDKKEQLVQAPTRSPGHFSPAPEVFLIRTPETITTPKQRVVPDSIQIPPLMRPSKPALLGEFPPRSRSPAPRTKVSRHPATEITSAQEKEESRTKISLDLASVTAGPSLSPHITQQVESTSRSHASGLRKRAKTPCPPDEEWTAVERQDTRQEVSEGFDFSQGLASTSPRAVSPEPSSARVVSPPPRNQSLGSKRHLPLTNSDTGHEEIYDQVPNHTYPSSPPATVRSLSPSPQPQPLTKPSRSHAHGHSKRLAAHEVTQQPFRPPTPPLPSHYRKKRSNDVLPSESFGAFMKPAVHVIYPDTSTSHGHSLSSDSVLALSGPRPPQNSGSTRPDFNDNIYSYTGERERPQSPSLLSSTSLDKDQDEYEETEAQKYPPVPPKARRSDVNHRGPPSGDELGPDFSIQRATRGRYPSTPLGQARAHTLTLPPPSGSSRGAQSNRAERAPNATPRARRMHQPHATKAARSTSEKVVRNNIVQPVARSKSSPLPSSRNRQRKGFWGLVGLWARVFMSKFRTLASPSPSPTQSSTQGGYY
ncbi:hypothetical protein DFH11DRAFT_328068 [Phellopilus nigrolimitatus]|nr:hypothetical protein DFH11DRAFT_328068 [Phellopilus nigrolimitatus]